MKLALLNVENLSVRIRTRAGEGLALDGVSFGLHGGEMLALVGESGCGKSMTALALMQLLPDAAQIVGGRIELEERDILGLKGRALEDLRGRRIGMVFQEPMTSLNPVLSIGRQMTEGLRRHLGLDRRAATLRAEQALASVRVNAPAHVMGQYPHQLSGGMRQRVMIAAALSLEPQILIADEPTTALDVTVQAQVLDLLADLRDAGSSVLMITHDLGVVAETADTVAVMYAGRIVETASVQVVLSRPAHPYTRGLLASHLELRPEPREAGSFPPPLATIPGSVPPITERPGGCSFRDRCAKAIERCASETPPLVAVAEGHRAACWRPFDA